jgi:hypothetical protein
MNVVALQRLWGVCLAVVGLAGALAPRRLLGLQVRLSLPGFENTDALEPKPWLVAATRRTAVATLVAGLVTVGLTADGRDPDVDANGVDTDAESPGGA